jgi:hypothetical protein
LTNSTLLKEPGAFLIRECFLWIIFAIPANFATLAFSINATFIERQIIAPLPVFKILQAKYRLFCIVSVILFILFLPSIFSGIKLTELIAAFLFAAGFGFFGLFLTSLTSYKPFNVKASSFYNFQGFHASNYLSPLLVLMVGVCFTELFYWLFNETITLIAMSLTGIVFIATSRIWLEKISKSFEKTRYRRLERFREK